MEARSSRWGIWWTQICTELNSVHLCNCNYIYICRNSHSRSFVFLYLISGFCIFLVGLLRPSSPHHSHCQQSDYQPLMHFRRKPSKTRSHRMHKSYGCILCSFQYVCDTWGRMTCFFRFLSYNPSAVLEWLARKFSSHANSLCNWSRFQWSKLDMSNVYPRCL